MRPSASASASASASRLLTLALALTLTLLVLSVSVSMRVSGQPLPLPVLPYGYNAYEPVLTEEAMRAHHLLHHRAYTDNLNAALREMRNRGGATKELAKLGIDLILARLDEVPQDIRIKIRNNGGGYVNHDLYFRMIMPPLMNRSSDGDGATTSTKQAAPLLHRSPASNSTILQAIIHDFGSYESFQTQFTDMAKQVFGSGWVFMYLDGESRTLKLMATQNQDNPIILTQNKSHLMLLCLDAWEHAYYIDYRNRRVEFINGWWSLVNWSAVEDQYRMFQVYDEIMAEIAQKRKDKQQQQAASNTETASTNTQESTAAEDANTNKDGL